MQGRPRVRGAGPGEAERVTLVPHLAVDLPRGIELGFDPGLELGARGLVHVHDSQATPLPLLGIDPAKFTFKLQGRAFRLTDVHGKVVQLVLA